MLSETDSQIKCFADLMVNPYPDFWELAQVYFETKRTENLSPRTIIAAYRMLKSFY